MKNAAVAATFDTMANVMEIRGDNAFRVNSYRKVARVLRDLAEDVEAVHAEGRLTDLPGIGKGSAEKIGQFLQTGRIRQLDELMADFPAGALEMLRVPNLGPKKVARLLNEKGIDSIDALSNAIEAGDLVGMAGMGAKTIENMRHGIEFLRSSAGRIMLGKALPVARGIVEALMEACDVRDVEVGGSLRRMRESVGDVDILATVNVAARKGKRDEVPGDEVPGGGEVVKAFTSLPGVAEVLAAGGTKGSVRTDDGLQVDLRVVRPESYGAALCYFTGSTAHNVKLRGIAQGRGLKLSEYGVFKGNRRVAGATEQDVYAKLGLPWIPPELREDRGEIEAAAEGDLPELVTLGDIRGELHAHTTHSDGRLSVLEMARAAQAMGYSYLAVTDHSQSLGVAGGLDLRGLERQQKDIDKARKELPGFTILKGTEVDILADGSLDYPDDVLAGLDVVIASVHSRFGMKEAEMTERIVRAAANPHVTAIGHLTGRLIGSREAYELDVGAVVAACAEHGTALELNANTERLDITDLVCRQAKEAGVKVAICTDAHHSRTMWMMQLGVGTARRGWLEAGDVLNCMPAEELLAHLGGRA